MASNPLNQLELPFVLPRPESGNRRHIHLGACIVDYRLIRSRRRSIGMIIDHRGLRVGAPHAVALADIEAFLRSNAKWVLRKLDEWRYVQHPRQLFVRDGATLPLLGVEWRIRVIGGINRVRFDEPEVVLEARRTADLRPLLMRGLRVRALDLFRERLVQYAPSVGCAPPPLVLSNAQTRWGSCSEKTGIRLNWRLIHLPLRLIDYVVAHELAHLVEMNHSPRFWSVVERLYPDYAAARAELKVHASAMPQF